MLQEMLFVRAHLDWLLSQRLITEEQHDSVLHDMQNELNSSASTEPVKRVGK